MNIKMRLNFLMKAAVLMLGLGCSLAQAEIIGSKLYESTTMVTAANLQVADLHITTPGSLTVQLTDMKFPDLLGNLSFMLTTATGIYLPTQTLGVNELTHTWSVNIAAPTTLYASIFASPKSVAGMYNVQIGFAANASPVPLPASLWLLLAGIAGVTAYRPKQKVSQSFA